MAKKFKDISNDLINDTEFSKLDLHISGLGYLKEEISRFKEVIIENEIQEIAEKPKVSNFEEKKKR